MKVPHWWHRAAIYEDGITMAEYTVDFKMTHSQTLLPMIDEMVKLVGIDLNTIDAIAVSGGPGSFTGLRIGSATARDLDWLNKPLIHVPTLDATAYNLFALPACLPDYGCQKKSGLCRFLYVGKRQADSSDRPHGRKH